LLSNSIKDPDPWVRHYAARSLGKIRASETVEMLAHLVEADESDLVRVAAAESLGQIGNVRSISVLSPLIANANRDLSRIAAYAIGSIGGKEMIPVLRRMLESNESVRRIDALHGLAATRSKEAIELIEWTAASDTDARVSDAAIRELAQSESTEAVTALLRLTSEPRLRETCVTALATLKPERIPALAGGVTHPQAHVREAVADALCRMRHPAASELLVQALNHPDAVIRTAARQALHRLRGA
jgi:HEAT repeat protein